MYHASVDYKFCSVVFDQVNNAWNTRKNHNCGGDESQLCELNDTFEDQQRDCDLDCNINFNFVKQIGFDLGKYLKDHKPKLQ